MGPVCPYLSSVVTSIFVKVIDTVKTTEKMREKSENSTVEMMEDCEVLWKENFCLLLQSTGSGYKIFRGGLSYKALHFPKLAVLVRIRAVLYDKVGSHRIS